MSAECEHVTDRIYLVRVVTEFRDFGRPRRHGWVVSQFGPEAVLLRVSVTHPKRVARAWARAWATEPTPAEPLGAIDNRLPTQLTGTRSTAMNELLLDTVARAANQATNLAATIGDAHHVTIDAAPVATMVLSDLMADARRLSDRLTQLKMLLEEEYR